MSQGKSKSKAYPAWGYVVITVLIASSCLFIPGVGLLRYFGFFKYKRPSQKPGQEMTIPPGSVTPSMSRVALPPSEQPLAGTEDD